MTTIINTPPVPPATPSDGGSGFVGIVVGVIILVLAVFLFFVYGLPAMRNTQNMNTGTSAPTINVPDKVQVEIKK